MAKVSTVRFLRRGCQRCGGDAFLDLSDEPEWRCLQCGRLVTNVAAADSEGRAVLVRAA
jgi:ribosomal protein S27AE